MTPSLVTVVIPFHPRWVARVNHEIEALSSQAKGNTPLPVIQQRLNDLAVVHYLSLVAIDVECPASKSEPLDARDSQSDGRAHLLIEATIDVPIDEALAVLADTLAAEIESVLAAAGVEHAGKPLVNLLRGHQRRISPGWGFRSALGQTHLGAPGMTVRRILRERDLADRLQDYVRRSVRTDRLGPSLQRNSLWGGMSPVQRLKFVRSFFWERPDMKWAFVEEPAPCLPADPSNLWNDSGYTLSNPQFRKALAWILSTYLWPLWLLLGIVWVALGIQAWRARSHWLDGVGMVLLAGLLLFVVSQVLLIGTAALRLRRQEKRDPSDEIVPPADQVRTLMDQENHFAQNHMATVSRLKPGLLRRLALRLAFVVVGSGRYVGAPGFLGVNGVIHVARWMRLPGTSQLVFWSNYDGTWESYVADFIADAPAGVTAIWSNCRGFPASHWLFGRGARQRDRLVNWARRQQLPTRFWYSAYPDLSAARIRNNAAIRQGLASATSDADARDWFALFGSQVRPARELELPEVPTLVFGGLTNRQYACCLLVRLRGNACSGLHAGADREAAREWLRQVEPLATFGPARPGQPAVAVALASSGLRKLGLPDEAMETFPTAFQQGMATEWRARALGDLGQNAPGKWRWGGGNEDDKRHVDVVVLIYARSRKELRTTRDPIAEQARRAGHTIVRRIPLYLKPWQRLDAPAESESSNKKRWVEPFRFVDGISQPVIRGAPRNGVSALGSDLVEPGEVVLGYPDNVGEIPPTPGLAACHDPEHFLPDKGCDPLRRRPEFSRHEPFDGERDLGANGTFLVVRQLKQNRAGFADWCKRSFEQLKHRPDVLVDMSGPEVAISSRQVNEPPEDIGARFVASLVLGRWPDGSSRVRNPRAQVTDKQPRARPDNGFMLGSEDPRGLACPFGSHVRRANPRDTRFHDTPEASKTELESVNRHRMLRVGRRYGAIDDRPSSGREAGLMFMCLNADIERQFEFVQKSWLLNRSMHGLEDEVDPLIGLLGTGPDGQPRKERAFTVPTPSGPINLKIDTDFVQVVGGGYFFMPARAVLRYLAGAAAAQRAAAASKVASPTSH